MGFGVIGVVTSATVHLCLWNHIYLIILTGGLLDSELSKCLHSAVLVAKVYKS